MKRLTLPVAVAMLELALPVRTARADAVPPPPAHCPKGQVGITGHGGPKCVPEAPKNCAPGYRGEIGGNCVLARCGSDSQCEGGQRCLQIEVCQEYRELHWTGWGWSAQRAVPRDNLLAEPPSPPPDGPPRKDWVLLSICGQDGPCNAPAQCRAAGLCYPPGAIGKTKAKLAAPGTPDAPPPNASAPTFATPPDEGSAGANDTADTNGVATAPTSSPGPTTPRDTPISEGGGGCRKGCSASSTPPLSGWMALPLLAGVGLLRRSRRAAKKGRRDGANATSPSSSHFRR
jgi:uncharacterized protein (TIGR03382 family)